MQQEKVFKTHYKTGIFSKPVHHLTRREIQTIDNSKNNVARL